MSEAQLLTTPATIGTLALRNRVVMAPLTRARCDPDTRNINAQNVLYYSMRAGTGLVITEATAISPQVRWSGDCCCL
jgi:N-ethylmaleimide reductase